MTSDFLSGGDGADSLIGGFGFDTLEGGVGNDTLDGGSDWDKLSGGDGADSLIGGDGRDTLDGGLGADVMDGGSGDDTYIIDNIRDIIRDSQGDDTIISDNLEVSLAYFADIENLTLSGSQINVVGNGLGGVLIGNAQNNRFRDGGGSKEMKGGLGDDVYVVTNSGSRVTEEKDQGYDIVISYRNFVLRVGSSVEEIRLQDSLEAEPPDERKAFYARGNELANLIIGNSYGNRIEGDGGADTMRGGDGDDIYYVQDEGDVVEEGSGVKSGTDFVASWLKSYTLTANVENLELVGDESRDGFGNALDNELTGNGYANSLSGGDGDDLIEGLYGDDTLDGGAGNDTLDGGLGSDSMTGGDGDDVYIVDSRGDRVIETGTGTDTIKAYISYAIGLLLNIENLTLLNPLGGLSPNLMLALGNAKNNKIIGNDGKNFLSGGAGNDTLDGGAGQDTLDGGMGDDTFIVADSSEILQENVGEGTDLVLAYCNLSIASFVDVENLTLMNPLTSGTSKDFTATGNNGANVITGNDGKNYLSGGAGADTLSGGLGDDTLEGGAGSDQLTGGTGNDRFVFKLVSDSTSSAADTITDFVAYDKIVLSEVDVDLSAAGVQKFVFNSTGAFKGVAGDLIFDKVNHFVLGDVNGDRVADFKIVMATTLNSMSSGDFIL